MSARPGPGGGYHAEWYPYRDQHQLRHNPLKEKWDFATVKWPALFQKVEGLVTNEPPLACQ